MSDGYYVKLTQEQMDELHGTASFAAVVEEERALYAGRMAAMENLRDVAEEFMQVASPLAIKLAAALNDVFALEKETE